MSKCGSSSTSTRCVLVLFLVSVFPILAQAEAIPVELRQTEDGAWELLRGGETYLIRGAGGTASLSRLSEAGANSIRTWDSKGIDGLLDEAHSLGLSVTVGFWLGHERHGFDYADADAVAEQKERVRQAVLRYKDHPAVLLWGIGNEMEGFGAGDNPLIWTAVNEIAEMIKKLDPNHPTMTVTAEIGGERIEFVHRRTPAIDIHGINSYGGATSIPERLRAGAATKPYVLTEFGPPGSWEGAATEWGAPYEMTSTEKAANYRAVYQKAVIEAPGMALGAYAFTWGYKMEATATWFGMVLEDGSMLGAVDAMTEIWTGEARTNRSPDIESLKIDGPAEFEPGSKVTVRGGASDPDNDELRSRWVLRFESGDNLTGGDYRRNMADIDGVVLDSDLNQATLRLPDSPDTYRLFHYVHDDAGNAAVANIPLRVKGEIRPRLPMPVYEDGLEGMPWAPSGWMGGTEFLTLDGDNTDDPYAGPAAIKLRYEGEYGWVGVAWQHPSGNWGEVDGGFDLGDATKLELWARGEYGGEKVKFGVGIIGDDAAYPDSGITSIDDISLTYEWQRFEIPLRNIDISSIKTGFVVTLVGRKTPVTIYLDSIRFIR